MSFVDSLIGSKNSVKTQTCLIKKHILPHIPEDKASTISEDDIKQLLYYRWNHLAPTTVKMLLGLLGRYLKYHNNQLNTTKFVRSLNINRNPIPKALSNHQATQLLSLCKKLDPELYPIILLGMHAGLRKGEIFGLKNKDLDFINNTITIQRSYNNAVKNNQARVVPMSKTLAKVLIKRNYLDSEDWVFKRFDPHRRIKKLFKLIGSPEKSCHSLRHTFATTGLDSGASIKQIQTVLGHTKASTTIDIYWSNIKPTLNLDFLPGEK